MLDLLKRLKKRYTLHMIAVSNEGREIAMYRVQRYNLGEFIDSFVVSSFVHLRKPDPEIYTLALDLAQVDRQEVVYIEDRNLSVEAAMAVGIPSIHHTDAQSTAKALKEMGLPADE